MLRVLLLQMCCCDAIAVDALLERANGFKLKKRRTAAGWLLLIGLFAEEEPVSVLAMLLSDLIKNKITPEELTETVTGREVEDYSEDVVLSTLVAVLLSLSKKTISYTFAALTRFSFQTRFF